MTLLSGFSPGDNNVGFRALRFMATNTGHSKCQVTSAEFPGAYLRRRSTDLAKSSRKEVRRVRRPPRVFAASGGDHQVIVLLVGVAYHAFDENSERIM